MATCQCTGECHDGICPTVGTPPGAQCHPTFAGVRNAAKLSEDRVREIAREEIHRALLRARVTLPTGVANL